MPDLKCHRHISGCHPNNPAHRHPHSPGAAITARAPFGLPHTTHTTPPPASNLVLHALPLWPPAFPVLYYKCPSPAPYRSSRRLFCHSYLITFLFCILIAYATCTTCTPYAHTRQPPHSLTTRALLGAESQHKPHTHTLHYLPSACPMPATTTSWTTGLWFFIRGWKVGYALFNQVGQVTTCHTYYAYRSVSYVFLDSSLLLLHHLHFSRTHTAHTTLFFFFFCTHMHTHTHTTRSRTPRPRTACRATCRARAPHAGAPSLDGRTAGLAYRDTTLYRAERRTRTLRRRRGARLWTGDVWLTLAAADGTPLLPRGAGARRLPAPSTFLPASLYRRRNLYLLL